MPLNAQLVKASEQRGYRARRDRFFQQGRVVSVNARTRTVLLDVNAYDNQGNKVYLANVGYQPTTIPNTQDIISLLYTNDSPHSATTGGVSVGGANTGGSGGTGVINNGGVMSVRKSGSAKLTGDVTVTGSGGTVITQSGQNLDIAGGAGTPATSVTSVAAAQVVGVSTNYARQDHVHDVAANALALSKLVQIADQRILGNVSGGTANVIELTAAQVLTMLGISAGTVTPYYRWRYYVSAFSGTLLDSTYFINLPPNIPGGVTLLRTREYAEGVGGSHRLSVGDTQLVFWNRIGIQNTTVGDITITFDVLGHDDSLVVLNEYGTDLSGTLGVTGTSITGTGGSGTTFNTDFVVGDYVKVQNGDLLRITAFGGTPASQMTAAHAPGLAYFLQHYRLAKTIYASTTATANVSGHYTATIKAGQTHVIHVLGNNNTGSGYWMVNLDALTISGLVFADPGA